MSQIPIFAESPPDDICVCRYRGEYSQEIILLLGSARKWTRIIQMTARGIKLRKVRNEETRHMKQVYRNGVEYPVARCAQIMLDSRLGRSACAERELLALI